MRRWRLFKAHKKNGSCPAQTISNALDALTIPGDNGELIVNIGIEGWSKLIQEAAQCLKQAQNPETASNLKEHIQFYFETTNSRGNI